MHPAELPLKRIQAALGDLNPITAFFIQNPTDGTGPQKAPVRVTFSSRYFVDAMGDGNTVAEASEALIQDIEDKKLCLCGCPRGRCG